MEFLLNGRACDWKAAGVNLGLVETQSEESLVPPHRLEGETIDRSGLVTTGDHAIHSPIFLGD